MKTSIENNTLTIYLKGRIDTSNAAAVEKEMVSAVEGAPDASLVLDAAGLEYISSAGLRILMKLRKMKKEGLPMINVSSDVYDILDVTGFTELLEVKKTLREISVDGCELIGSGGYGKVYRIDKETIAKIYSPGVSLSFVEQERNTSQKAFLMGVPTAISYDVVKCGDCYGVVYELLNAKTTAQIIDENPAKIQEVFGKSAALLKLLHQIVPGDDSGLPDRKDKLLSWVDSISEYITEEEAAKIKGFIRSIPDRNTFLHGDYNAKNVMIQDGEFLLIDIGDAAIGHPVFDIAGLMLAFIILPNSRGGGKSDEELKRLLGFDFQYAQSVWGVMCATYFGLRTPEEIGAVTQKLMPYCLLLMSFHAFGVNRGNEAMNKILVEKVVREKLLPSIDYAQPIDF